VLLLRVWKPSDAAAAAPHPHKPGEVFLAWIPYLCLVVIVLVWGIPSVKAWLDQVTKVFAWPGLHNHIQRLPPVTRTPSAYGAMYSFSWLSASGTSCLFAVFAAAAILRVSPAKLARWTWDTTRQLALPLLTIAAVLALAYLMNYSGATASMGLAMAGTAGFFPFFSPLLGWLGVFLTGSDTSANALFGPLQVITSNALGFNPALMAAANSSGGVMGKMISLASIAVAAAATGLKRDEEGRLFSFTLKHSIFLAFVTGLVVLVYAYWVPGWAR
jgi:lactate permease